MSEPLRSSPSVDRLHALQALRFFAALSVLFGHSLTEGIDLGFLDAATFAPLARLPWGNGVDVFFVISGFIMFHIAGTEFGVPGASGRFLAKRFIRLVPIYWLFTIAMLVATLLFASVLSHSTLDAAHVAASFAFIPWLDSSGLPHPVLGLGWTLNYEMFFYVLFALALLLPRRAGLPALLAVFTLLAIAHPLVDPAATQLRFWTDPIIIEFLFGIGIAAFRRRGVTLSPVLCWALAAGGAALLLTIEPLFGSPGDARFISAGLPAALIVLGFAFMPFDAATRPGRFLAMGGDASYALYLSHPFAINAAALLLRRVGLSGWVMLPAVLLGALGVAALVYLLVERRLTRWLGARLSVQPKTLEKIAA